ncbi:MAG: efflux RND transporter permease subunit [Candidatus Zixiibacteriota bacterium]|nr:MAG: efflux RND transporter permease subunit [candidate division Zixibacteria bacterium]
MKSFFRFFAERHKLATLITIMTIMLGLSTLVSIKRDIYPRVDFGMMTIITRYPGASPEDVELNVTNKIEEELKSVTDIDKTTSVSVENVSVIIVTIDIDASDQDDVKNKIREAVGRVTDFPPEVTESPRVTELNSGIMDVIEVGLSGDVPYRQLREEARILEKKLRNVPGVSRLEKFGYRAREIKIEVSPEAARNYQIPLREIIGAIRGRNIRGTTGSFESYTSEKNLVTLAQFQDPLEVSNVIVRSTFDGPVIKVSDLAAVSDDFEDERVTSRMNGKEAISFLVFISETADAIRTCDAVKELVARERETLGEGIEILHVNDESRYVRDSFDVVLSNGWIGLLLVLILLTIFLNFRTAFWVALGIPVALLGTIFFLPVFGMYLDTITLSGMILVIGIIVDDAIIIAENIARRREKGDSPMDAAVEGIREVFRPVVTTVLTTFLVFAPMFFMPGLFGKYIIPIPLAISVALFISLGEAMVALPAHLVPGLRRQGLKSAGNGWFKTVRMNFQSAMTKVLRFRYLLVPVFVIALAGSVWYAGNYIKFVLFPSDQADTFYMLIELPTGTTLEATSDKVREIEAIVADLPPEELASFNTRIGTNYSEIFVMAESENYAALRVRLTPYSERSRNANQIVEDLRRKTDQVEGIDEIVYGTESGGPPVGKPVNIRLVGSDDALRQKLTDSVEAFLASMSGVKDISRDDKPGKDQVEIQINYDRLSRLGLTVADVAQNVRIAYDGEVVTSVRYGDEEVDFRIMMEERARRRLDYLTELTIPNRQGRLIPLSEIARLDLGPGPSDYRHYDGERTVTIEADVDVDVITPLEVTDAVFEQFDVDRDWPGMQIGIGGEAFETEESMAGLFRTFLIAVIAIYFLLVILFNSFTQPFLVMVAIPFGITGVIVAFGLHGEPFSFLAILGIIGLSGVVVNDSLVMVSHINDLKQQRKDVSIRDIVAEGTADRLRAVILTTLTTVVALLPLAYGIGGTAVFMAPMALSLGWGLFFATPLTLILVPCLYVIGQDVGGLFKRGDKC